MTSLESGAMGQRATLASYIQSAMRLRRSAQVAKAARGGAWSMTGYGFQMALRFVSRVLVAKLVVDAAPLGTVAFVTTALLGLEMISDLGINVNIIQHRQGEGADFLKTARTIQLLRSLALFGIVVIAAYPVAWIYHDPQLAPLLIFAGTMIVLRGFYNPGMAVLVRNVDLKRPTLVNMATELVGFIVVVIWAMQAPSAWALVAGAVASSAAMALLSQVAAPNAGFGWNPAIARSIIRFGGWILLSTSTWFFASRGEVFMLKGSVPAVEFGCFAFASMLVATPLSAVTQLGSQVMMPMLAKWVRDGDDAVGRPFRRVKWMFTGLAVCFAWGAILLGPPVIGLLHLNDSYAPLGWMVQFLGVRAALDVFALPSSNALLASGASRYSAVANTVRLAALGLGLLLTLKVFGLGLEAAIWVLVGAPVLSYLTLLPGIARRVKGSLPVEFATMATFAVAVALAAFLAVVLGVR